MSAHGSRRTGSPAAEQPLGGTQADAALARLLDAAAAPARPDELAGERAAVVAFRAAAAPRPRTATVTVKVAAAVIAVMATGGVAVAAATGQFAGPSVSPATHRVVIGTTTPVVSSTIVATSTHGTPTSRPARVAPPTSTHGNHSRHPGRHPGGPPNGRPHPNH